MIYKNGTARLLGLNMWVRKTFIPMSFLGSLQALALKPALLAYKASKRDVPFLRLIMVQRYTIFSNGCNFFSNM